MKTKFAKITSLLLVLVLTFMLTACGSDNADAAADVADEPQEKITIVFSTHNNDQDIQNSEIWIPFFEKLNELSGGLVEAEMHYNAELVGPADALEAVENGIVDCAFVRATTAGFAWDSVVEMSFPSNQCNRMSRVYNELYDMYPEMQENYANVQPVLLYTLSHCYLGTTGDEIRVPADMQGKMMIVNNSLMGEWITSLGATPVSSPPTEFYTNLEKGIADGSPAPLTSIMISDSWYEVCPYVLDISSSVTTVSIVMNKDTFNKLPEACQEYILNGRYEWADKIDEMMLEDDINGLKMMQEQHGLTVVVPTEEELALWDEASADLLPNYVAALDAEGLPGTEFLNDYYALVEKYTD